MGESVLYTALPVPYIESVEVYNNKMEVLMSMYIPVTKRDFAFDEGKSYLLTLTDLVITVMALFDRNSSTSACGIAPEDTDEQFNNLSTSAWSDYLKNKVAPTRYFYGEAPLEFSSAEDAMTEIVTNFVFDPAAADLDKLIEGLREEEFFEDYKLPVDSSGDENNATYANILNYIDDRLSYLPEIDEDSDVYKLERRSIIIALINQVVSNNDYVMAKKLFGFLTWHAESDPEVIDIKGFIPNMQIVKVHAKTVPLSVPFAEFANNITDIMIKEDGSAIMKLSASKTIDSSIISPAVYGFQKNIGVKNMGLVAFSAPWSELRGGDIVEVHDEIRDAVIGKKPEIAYWDNSISQTNHILIVHEDDVSREPAVAFVDDNDVIYHDALRSLDGSYHEVTSTPYQTIINTMQATVADFNIDDETKLSFQYVLAQSVLDPTDTLSLINKYRKAFPDKSTTTVAGQFYNAFAEALYNTNTELKRGKRLRKVLITNPIVKDWRTALAGTPFGGTHVGEDFKETYYELFDLSQALWSRYTQVTGYDPAEETISEAGMADTKAAVVAGTVESGADMSNYEYTTYSRSGGQWNYNFIDHGFMFFNYEKALKNTSYASRYMNIKSYEKYFGPAVFNSLFTMEKCYLRAYWGDPDDVIANTYGVWDDGENKVWPIGAMQLEIPDMSHNWSSQITTFYDTTTATQGYNDDAQVNTDKFDVVVENSLVGVDPDGFVETDLGDETTREAAPTRLANAYGGADAMVKSKEYSFLALRGFSPATVGGAIDPFHVDSTFLDGDPLKYRMACIEFQKCDAYDGFEARNSVSIVNDISEEVEESTRGGAFRAGMLVKDKTHDVILELKNQFDRSYALFEEYKEAANDKCAFNDGTGYFNQFFIDTVLLNWPDITTAPYYKPIVELVMFEDIFYSAYNADEATVMTEIEKLVFAISPETGTVSGINNMADRFDNIKNAIDEIITDHGSSSKTVGHIYGHSPFYDEDYDWVSTNFDMDVQNPGAVDRLQTTNAPWTQAYVPDAGYDNYPLYPADMSYTSSQVTVYEVDPDTEISADLDKTDGLNTIIEDLLDGLELSNSITNVMVDMLLTEMAEIESKLGLDSWRGYTTDAIEILDLIAGTIGSTFPDYEDFMNGDSRTYMDPYGNMGAEAAENIGIILENFADVAGVITGAMESLATLNVADLNGVVPAVMVSMFEAGSYDVSATVDDFLDTDSAALQNLNSMVVSMNLTNMMGSSYTGAQRFSWL